MSDVAIRFNQVSKRYRLRRGSHFSSLREEAARVVRGLVGRSSSRPEHFWALRDVSFEIRKGETVGLIGANGAGKSTTLKILSRVTVPSSGTFEASGTIGGIIEIGAGFHPDLTGRENIYLNAAIMGMRRPEINAKYDRIVTFADIGQFIDTPIKYYSSGMEVRLGFAVAAHLDPDIMLVDEVLAVGDVGFQAKCLNKLAELKEQDRTIVLVSHNTIAILQHCDRVIWIDHGTVRAVGEPEKIIEQYLHTVQPHSAGGQSATTTDTPIRITDVTVRGADQQVADTLEHGRPGTLEIGYEVLAPVDDPVVYVSIHDVNGLPLGGLTTRLDGLKLDTRHGNGMARLVFAPVMFTRGRFRVAVAILDHRLQRFLDLRHDATSFAVDGPSVGSREVYGHIVYPHWWEVDADDA